ncbi:hypothetical protein BDR26DRAFT_582115 [Obelidium mucronatum]|nr:hypothetical protein BDR26DRAFT_582115 [Obelidium mucronatum]
MLTTGGFGRRMKEMDRENRDLVKGTINLSKFVYQKRVDPMSNKISSATTLPTADAFIITNGFDITNGLEPRRIPFLLGQPAITAPEFKYSPKNTLIGGIPIRKPEEGSMYDGCQCEGSCGTEANQETCGCLIQHGQAYLKYQTGCLDGCFSDSMPVYECNSNCSCSASCFNRVVGRGITGSFRVTGTDGKGFALVTTSWIRESQFVMEYAGEVIRAAEAQRRWIVQRKNQKPNYIICIKEHTETQTYRTNIDPSLFGNAARFINHSCSPNLYFRTVRIDSIICSAGLFALRDIEPGEELSFDYGDCGADFGSNSDDGRIPCRCNASNCRGFLPFDSTL